MSRVYLIVGLCLSSHGNSTSLWPYTQIKLEPPPARAQGPGMRQHPHQEKLSSPFLLREEGFLNEHTIPRKKKKQFDIFLTIWNFFSSTTSYLASALILIELRREKRNQFTLHMLQGKKHPSLNTMEYVGRRKRR